MSKRKRAFTRRAARRNERHGEALLSTSEGRLALEAARSLEMDAETFAEAFLAMTDPSPETVGFALERDALFVRCLDILSVLGHTHFLDGDIAQQRAELLSRRGAAFFAKVATMGEPASEAALRIRYNGVNCGNLARLRASVDSVSNKWTSRRGGSRLRSARGTRHPIGFGRRSARTSSQKRASRRRSLSGSISKRSAPTTSGGSESPSTPSDEPAASSSAPRTPSHRSGRPCVSCTADRASNAPAPPEAVSSAVTTSPVADRRLAWTQYRLRVQNLLLSWPSGLPLSSAERESVATVARLVEVIRGA